MQRSAMAKMKIELPLMRAVLAAPVAGVGRHVPHLHVLQGDVVLGLGLAGLAEPAAQRVGDAVLRDRR